MMGHTRVRTAFLAVLAAVIPVTRAWSFTPGQLSQLPLRANQVPRACASGHVAPMMLSTQGEQRTFSRLDFVQALLGGFSMSVLNCVPPAVAEEDDKTFTVAFNASKGSLGIGLQELRFPRKKSPWDKQMEVVTVSSVDPYGQGVRQDKRLRPGLVITRVQGRGVEGLTAKEVIKQLENEMLARSAGDVRAAEEEGLPELVEISFSSKCISTPDEPDYCYNSVQPLDSVIGG